jgi:hypothetical protein
VRCGIAVHLVSLAALFATSQAIAGDVQKPKPANGPDCARRGSTTIHLDRILRVYEVRQGYRTKTYACFRSNNLRRLLNIDGEYSASKLSGFQVRRPWIGFHELRHERYFQPSSTATVYNMRTKARVFGGGEAIGVHGFGITRKGSLAWLETRDAENWPDSEPTTVYLRAAGSATTVELDWGADIDVASFATAGKRIYWMKGEMAKTATMP